MRTLLNGLLGTILLSLPPADGTGASSPASSWIAFETTPQSALPIVAARVNGSEGYRLVLDPSVDEVLLDTTLVQGRGMSLATRGESAFIDYYRTREKVPVVYLDVLEVGPVAARGLRALLIEGDDLTSREGIRSYGRIGREFLKSFRLTVHYPRQLLLLEPSPEGEAPTGGVAFDLSGRFIIIKVRLNGSMDGEFVLDPGASTMVLDRHWAFRHRLAEKDAYSADLSLLEIGGFSLADVPAVLGELKQFPYRGHAIGVLGASLLRKLAVTYDFPRAMLWLRQADGGRT